MKRLLLLSILLVPSLASATGYEYIKTPSCDKFDAVFSKIHTASIDLSAWNASAEHQVEYDGDLALNCTKYMLGNDQQKKSAIDGVASARDRSVKNFEVMKHYKKWLDDSIPAIQKGLENFGDLSGCKSELEMATRRLKADFNTESSYLKKVLLNCK